MLCPYFVLFVSYVVNGFLRIGSVAGAPSTLRYVYTFAAEHGVGIGLRLGQ